MKITVLGATGPTGRLVIEQALERGDEVVAYVRNPQGLQGKLGLEIVDGQLDDVLALKVAIEGTDAVLVCLGTHEKKNVDLMQKSMPLIIQAMKSAQVQRLVLMSAYGVGETARTAALVARVAYKLMVAPVYQDKQRAEALLLGSGLKWTIVYPVVLTDGPLAEAEVRPMTQVSKVSGLPKVSRASVARALLDAARNDRTIRQKLLVSKPGSVL